MNKIVCIEQMRNQMQRETVAGAGKRMQDRYQRRRIVDQFLLRPEPKSIAARENVTTRQVLAIVRDRLAAKEAA